MRLIVKQTECAGKMFWIVRDMEHSWFYHGPLEDEIAAQAFARQEAVDDLKNAIRARLTHLRLARERRRLLAQRKIRGGDRRGGGPRMSKPTTFREHDIV